MAWAQFRQTLSLQSDLALRDNPLPASIVLIPAQQDAADLEALIIMLRDLAEVDDIQIDLAWISKLNSLLALAERQGAELSTHRAVFALVRAIEAASRP